MFFILDIRRHSWIEPRLNFIRSHNRLDSAGIIEQIVGERMVYLKYCWNLSAVERLVVLKRLVLLLENDFFLQKDAIMFFKCH